MKKLLAIAFFAMTLVGSAQTRLDTLIFTKVNEYRVENSLSPFKWSQSAHCVAQNQAEYCSRVKYVLHDQEDSSANDSTFQIEPDFGSRFRKCGVGADLKIHTIAENLLVYVDTTRDFSATLEKVADETLDGWKTSPSHNAMMLMNDLEFASIAHVISDSYAQTSVDITTMEEYTVSVKGKAYYIALDAYK